MTATTTEVHGGPTRLDLVERGVIRLRDLLVISKAEDGAVEAEELTDPTGAGAAPIVYENSWAVPFVGAVRNRGGELIASARIPAPAVMAALDALDALDALESEN